jgi:hypothetical protein
LGVVVVCDVVVGQGSTPAVKSDVIRPPNPFLILDSWGMKLAGVKIAFSIIPRRE